MSVTSHHQLPRAGVDPIRSDGVALATVLGVAHQPARPETIALLLDDARRGLAIVVVDRTAEHDDVVEVAERLLDVRAHGGCVGAAVIASCRPGAGCELADADRWLELRDVAETNGVELVEWYVVGDHEVARPRELLNAPSNW